MSMFPHTVTLYNTRQETDKKTFKDITVNYITVLHGVLFDASKASNVRASGLEGADAANLYIPFDVEALDGITGEPKTYIGPIEFGRLDDVGDYWTLGTGGDTNVVKGIVVEPDQDIQFLEAAYDDVYRVTKSDEKDFGNLKHWEVGCN